MAPTPAVTGVDVTVVKNELSTAGCLLSSQTEYNLQLALLAGKGFRLRVRLLSRSLYFMPEWSPFTSKITWS